MSTARDLCTFSLREAGVVGVGQDPLAQDIDNAFTLLTRMLAQWQVKRWLVPGLTKVSATADGSISNTIGPGEHYNCMRPDKILAAYFRQLNTGSSLPVSYPLAPIWAYEDYARVVIKTLNSFPQFFFYDNAFPAGNVHIWPIPSDQYEVTLVVKMPIQQKTSISVGSITDGGLLYTDGSYVAVDLTGGSGAGATADITVTAGVITIVTLADPGQGYAVGDLLSVDAADVGGTGVGFVYTVDLTVSNLDTEIILPDEYLEAVHYNLCVRLVSFYQYSANPVQGVLAKNSLNVIKNANAQVPTLVIPYANRTGFNIYAPDIRQ